MVVQMTVGAGKSMARGVYAVLPSGSDTDATGAAQKGARASMQRVLETIELRGLGEVVYASKHEPLAILEADGPGLRQMARLSNVASVLPAPNGTALEQQSGGGPTAIDPQDYYGLATVHEQGIDGAGVKVGVIEEGYCNPVRTTPTGV